MAQMRFDFLFGGGVFGNTGENGAAAGDTK